MEIVKIHVTSEDLVKMNVTNEESSFSQVHLSHLFYKFWIPPFLVKPKWSQVHVKMAGHSKCSFQVDDIGQASLVATTARQLGPCFVNGP